MGGKSFQGKNFGKYKYIQNKNNHNKRETGQPLQRAWSVIKLMAQTFFTSIRPHIPHLEAVHLILVSNVN